MIGAEGVDNLYRYFCELKKWSPKVNLIAKNMADSEILENHLLDSLTLLPLLEGERVHLLDIGTGAGFPGLVVKAARRDLAVTLVEPRQKRVTFLRHVARNLGLAEVTVLACRAEEEALLLSGLGATHVTSRAVSDVAVFLQMAERFARCGARVVCMKGPRWEEELEQAERVGIAAVYHLEQVVHRSLPFSGASRTLLVFTHRCVADSGS